MAQNYFSIVTNKGRNKLALSAAGGAAVTITHFAIGDGNGAEVNPTAASTALVREVWRTPVESVVIDPLNPSAVLVTSIIPTAAGGWWMREFGIFDVDGDMIAVAKPVSQYKPTALEGQLEDIRYEFQIIIGETANVTMLVDPSVLLASRAWVEGRKVPVAQLSLTPWVPVKSMTVTAPPATPTAWDTYVIPAGATGAWAGHAQKLAEWNGQSWNIITPQNGHGISLPNGRVFEKISGSYVEKLALDVQSGRWNFASVGGTTAALTGTLPIAPGQLYDGLTVIIDPNFAPSAGATFNLNGTGAKAISGADGAAIRVGDILPDVPAVLIYSEQMEKWILSSLSRLPTQALGFKAKHTTTISIPNVTPTIAIFDQIEFDTSAMYDAANGTATVPVRGIWNVFANFFFEDITNHTNITLRKNGINVAEAASHSRGRILAMSTALLCNQGDVLSLAIVQASGATMTISAAARNLDYPFVFSASFSGTI